MSEEVKEEIESPPPYEGPMLLPMTDSSLSKIPEPVDLEKEDLKQLKADLLESMYHFGGIGLSANQVGIDKKFFVLGSELVTDEEENKFEKSFFNPTLLTVSEEEESVKEGCLSYPGLWLMVKRPVQCTIKYYNSEGEEIVETYEGVSARVILHEYDHMLGMNFTQRVSKLKLERGLKAAEKKFKKHQRRMARLLGI
jgi:peptide deformylase